MATDTFAEFQSYYKYRILGKADNTYYNLARSVGNNDVADRIKSRRTGMEIQIAQLKASGQDSSVINQKTGELQLNFIRSATSNLYEGVRDTKFISEYRNSIGNLTKELETAVNKYLSSTTRTAADDAKFKEGVEFTLRRLSLINTTIKGRSAAAGTTFDINLYQSSNRINSLRDLMQNFPAAGAGAAAAAAPEAATAPEGGVDITV